MSISSEYGYYLFKLMIHLKLHFENWTECCQANLSSNQYIVERTKNSEQLFIMHFAYSGLMKNDKNQYLILRDENVQCH